MSNRFKVGQKVFARLKVGDDHRYGFTGDMTNFADGAEGTIVYVALDSYGVKVDGVDVSYCYDEKELSEIPRGVRPAKFAPLKEKPTKGLSVKPVDKRQKTLYAVIKNGFPIYTTTKRAEAREVKAKRGGLKAGVTIVAYKAINEIR